jgi:hypothetical protein
MEIAVALDKHASNISTILRLDNRFIKVHKEGRAVYYGLAFMEIKYPKPKKEGE